MKAISTDATVTRVTNENILKRSQGLERSGFSELFGMVNFKRLNCYSEMLCGVSGLLAC